MNSEELTIYIERYLDGELSDEEKLQFEQNLLSDKVLAKELKLHKVIRESIGNEELRDLRAQLNTLTNEYRKKESIIRRVKHTVLYAASVTIFVVFSVFYFHDSKVSNDELFSKYYERFDFETATRGSTDTSTDIFTNALLNYEDGKYNEAIEQFEKIPDTSEYYSSKEFVTGLSYMELKNYNNAIRRFESVIYDKRNIFYYDAIWYCGLCYVKTNQTKKAKQIFIYLKRNSSFYQEKSEEILKNL